jgi:hypothetical protein
VAFTKAVQSMRQILLNLVPYQTVNYGASIQIYIAGIDIRSQH